VHQRYHKKAYQRGRGGRYSRRGRRRSYEENERRTEQAVQEEPEKEIDMDKIKRNNNDELLEELKETKQKSESPKQQELSPLSAPQKKSSGQLNVKAEPFKRTSGSKITSPIESMSSKALSQNAPSKTEQKTLNTHVKPFVPKQNPSQPPAQPQLIPGGNVFNPYGMTINPAAAGLYQNIYLVQGSQPGVFQMPTAYPPNYLMQMHPRMENYIKYIYSKYNNWTNGNTYGTYGAYRTSRTNWSYW